MTRRRALLARVESEPGINTSPRIAEYDKKCDRNSTTVSTSEGYCYTVWYDIVPISNTIIHLVGENMPGSPACFQYTLVGGGRDWDYFPTRIIVAANANTIRFSLITANIDTSYVYVQETGQILFAGRNTPYYGYTNINDMPTGT